MSTVVEIEAAIDRLPVGEQQQLRDWLLTRMAPTGPMASSEQSAWLAGLANLRAKVATGKTTPANDALWDDLRGERDA